MSCCQLYKHEQTVIAFYNNLAGLFVFIQTPEFDLTTVNDRDLEHVFAVDRIYEQTNIPETRQKIANWIKEWKKCSPFSMMIITKKVSGIGNSEFMGYAGLIKGELEGEASLSIRLFPKYGENFEKVTEAVAIAYAHAILAIFNCKLNKLSFKIQSKNQFCIIILQNLGMRLIKQETETSHYSLEISENVRKKKSCNCKQLGCSIL